MRTNPAWRGVRMRTVDMPPDPDSPARRVTLPASWDDAAAAGLAVLLPGSGAVALAEAAEAWLGPLGWQARQRCWAPDLDVRLRDLLLRRRAAPSLPLWRCAPRASERGASEGGAPEQGASGREASHAEALRLVLALPGFHDPQVGLDLPALLGAVETLAVALRLLPGATLGPAGLDDLLAALGLDYDSPAARDVAACLVALLHGALGVALARPEVGDGAGHAFGASDPAMPGLLAGAWPPDCVVPGLTEAAREAWAGAAGLGREGAFLPGEADGAGRGRAGGAEGPVKLALGLAGAAEALLGVETAGLAPAFAPVTTEGRLTRATQARLAATGRSPEAALGALLSGEALLRPAAPSAHAAMLAAVAPFLRAPGVHGQGGRELAVGASDLGVPGVGMAGVGVPGVDGSALDAAAAELRVPGLGVPALGVPGLGVPDADDGVADLAALRSGIEPARAGPGREAERAAGAGSATALPVTGRPATASPDVERATAARSGSERADGAARPGEARPVPARHVPLPDRHAGLTRRAQLGGHRIFLRTAEYADGALGELGVTLPREGAAMRGLTDAFATAVSLGLQHGVPLEAFVEAFALSRFGPAGAVEGDPAVTRATSVPDYVVRTLSAQYLGRIVPAPEPEEPDLPLPLLRLVR